jgi:hypothetical protein
LGVISTLTGKAYAYAGLAMGAGTSPSIAGGMGASFLRKLRTSSPYYQGTISVNTWWQAFARVKPIDPDLSHGRVLISLIENLPAALAFAHCDDFMIHGPTHEKARLAAFDFLDLALKVGLLAHPDKLTPPNRIVKYTGFIWDTTGIPTLKIPAYKVDKSFALIDYAIDHRKRISRLCLTVVKGDLESEVDATPGRAIHISGFSNIPFTLWIGRVSRIIPSPPFRRRHRQPPMVETSADSQSWSDQPVRQC